MVYKVYSGLQTDGNNRLHKFPLVVVHLAMDLLNRDDMVGIGSEAYGVSKKTFVISIERVCRKAYGDRRDLLGAKGMRLPGNHPAIPHRLKS